MVQTVANEHNMPPVGTNCRNVISRTVYPCKKCKRYDYKAGEGNIDCLAFVAAHLQ